MLSTSFHSSPTDAVLNLSNPFEMANFCSANFVKTEPCYEFLRSAKRDAGVETQKPEPWTVK